MHTPLDGGSGSPSPRSNSGIDASLALSPNTSYSEKQKLISVHSLLQLKTTVLLQNGLHLLHASY